MNYKMFQYVLLVVMTVFFAADASGQAKGAPDRTVLPIAEPTYAPITELDARKAKPPRRFEVKAPKGAPSLECGAQRGAG